MARGPASSRREGAPGAVLAVILGCTGFSLGLLTAPSPASSDLARPIKTSVRALADGSDVGFDLKAGAWVGLNPTAFGQTALYALGDRTASAAAVSNQPTDLVADTSQLSMRH